MTTMTLQEIENAIKQWKEEDGEHRAFIFLADGKTSGDSVRMFFSGRHLDLLTLMLCAMLEDEDFKRLVKDAVAVAEKKKKVRQNES